MIELLSPVGDIDCLKAAVQNGADSVYFGSNMFSARAFASNFDSEELKNAIQYAKLRGVKTNLTLNTLIKNLEFEDAFNVAKKAYEYGIDAIIVQDLGLAKTLIKAFPNLPIHASTQMSVHNLHGTLELQNLGFKRVVLARELSAQDIEYISNNSNVELECFIHGALCISYSGQCLFSSMIGGRSGNRGTCAQPCRLPYTLIDEQNKELDKGYLLSTRDLCGLEYIPFLINAGVKCLKIEGRMKNAEYVATVTRIYRKYIDLANSNEKYIIDEKDKKDLLQVFNRGNFSCGHFKKPNKNLVFKEKQNNMGLYLGTVEKFNSNKGLINLKLKENLAIGDKISLEYEDGTYTVSELMKNNNNIKTAESGDIVTIGRMKGNIKKGNKIFKISSKELSNIALESFKNENKKILLSCTVSIKKDKPIKVNVKSANNLELYKRLNINYTSNIIPDESINKPLDEESILKQFSKTNSSLYEFKNITINLDKNLFVTIGLLNDLRRTILEQVENFAINNINRTTKNFKLSKPVYINKQSNSTTPKISLLLNTIHTEYDYSNLQNVENIYIPLKYFLKSKYKTVLNELGKKSNIYIYLPTIIKANYRNLMHSNIEKSVLKYNIKGFVLSNISNFLLLEDFNKKDFDFVANYTFNIFNNLTVNELKKLGIDKFTLSPELDKSTIIELCNNTNLPKELIVYGNTPLMNINYCLLGKSNKCYPSCSAKCNLGKNFYLKDRLGMKFLVVPDNIQTVSTIYNSKTTSISYKDFNIDSVRIDILNENIDEINNIIDIVKSGKRLEGKEYTNGNLNKEI